MLKSRSPLSGVKRTWKRETVKPVSFWLLEQLFKESDTIMRSAEALIANSHTESNAVRPMEGHWHRMLVRLGTGGYVKGSRGCGRLVMRSVLIFVY